MGDFKDSEKEKGATGKSKEFTGWSGMKGRTSLAKCRKKKAAEGPVTGGQREKKNPFRVTLTAAPKGS